MLFELTTDAPITISYIGMLALARAKLAQVRAAARGDPLFSITMTLTSTCALGKWCYVGIKMAVLKNLKFSKSARPKLQGKLQPLKLP